MSSGEPAPPGFAEADDVGSARSAFRAWMFGHALPFWGSAGHDGPGRGAREHLRLDGTPAGVGFKRMRVQARQVYAFSHAALLGWQDGERLARDGYGFITRCGRRPDGGWVRRLSADGSAVLDGAADLYDQAFVLFALAWYARLTRDAEPLQRARGTVEWIRAHMAAPPNGFHNAIPAESGPRQQNPHMHLLEAVLALHETSGDAYYAAFAHELVGLFRRRLFDPATGTLGEFFTHEWLPAPGKEGGHVEPGHHYEWVWLLDRYERQTGGTATVELDRLYQFARAFGTDPVTGMVWDVVGRDGSVRERSARLWPQTESLKAHAVMARRNGGGTALIPLVVRNIGTHFLAGCPVGAWVDQLDAAGAPVSDKIPASSLYHVLMSYAELSSLADQISPETRRLAAHSQSHPHVA
jgi:mannose/cellobiose epimerase-like protein (N-acyl-D-glucosamine 2-epimerase family)